MTDSPATGDVQGTDSAPKFVSLFMPQTAYAKDNMKLITTLVVIWAVAVFGFQILILVMQTPTPEANHGIYTGVWSQIEAGTATAEQERAFAKVTLSVLGKNIVVKAPHKETLKQALSATVLGLIPESRRAGFLVQVASADKKMAVETAIQAIDLDDKGFELLMRGLLPTSLVPVPGTALTDAVKKDIPGVMDLYLIHNQSALTDSQFLGFPFHYWYTAQGLLILFVLLCFVYAKMIDRVMIKHGRMKKEEN